MLRFAILAVITALLAALTSAQQQQQQQQCGDADKKTVNGVTYCSTAVRDLTFTFGGNSATAVALEIKLGTVTYYNGVASTEDGSGVDRLAEAVFRTPSMPGPTGTLARLMSNHLVNKYPLDSFIKSQRASAAPGSCWKNGVVDGVADAVLLKEWDDSVDTMLSDAGKLTRDLVYSVAWAWSNTTASTSSVRQQQHQQQQWPALAMTLGSGPEQVLLLETFANATDAVGDGMRLCRAHSLLDHVWSTYFFGAANSETM